MREDGRSIAYQVFGSGPVTMVFCWGLASHLDLQWTNPDLARMFERIAAFCRVIVFDKVGSGLSDPIDYVPTLEDRLQDIAAVLSATGTERAVLFGESEAGPTAMLYAALHPDQVQALIVFGSIAQGWNDDDDPDWASDRVREAFTRLRELLNDWGKGGMLELFAPSIAGPAVLRRSFAVFERSSVSPSMARALIGLYRTIDISDVLPSIDVPTLVLHRRDDWIPVEQGRYIASRIPKARYVELEGRDHLICVGDVDSVLNEIRRFVGEVTASDTAAATAADRMLATVMFTDIVESTPRAAELGDSAWRQLLERHAAITADQVRAAGGRVVKSTGDGVLAVFTGPARAIQCATALSRNLAELDLPIRCGIHTGECELIGDDVGGLAVHVGARIAALARAGEVLTSSTVKELVLGSGIRFDDRGLHTLKGLAEPWRVFAVAGSSPRTGVEAPAAHMKAGDRVVVRLARRAPRTMRALGRFSAK